MFHDNDPLWAYKENMGPEERQAYEIQRAANNAAHQQHRREADLVAIGTGIAATYAYFSKPREERQAERDQRKQWRMANREERRQRQEAKAQYWHDRYNS